MKATILVEKEVDLQTLEVSADVRYWEDATANARLITAAPELYELLQRFVQFKMNEINGLEMSHDAWFELLNESMDVLKKIEGNDE